MAAVIPGYHGNLLRVDLSTGLIAATPLDEHILRSHLGGTGLGARILLDELEPGVDPLAPAALLLFLAGPFAGTRIPCGDRTSVVCKSPLTGVWADSDVGGRFAGALRSCGFDGLVIRGQAHQPLYLHIFDGSARLQEAGHLWGLDTYQTHDRLASDAGGRISTMTIGPAGERRVNLASIVSDGRDARVAARCGVGAVMGSKRLKAVVAERGSRAIAIRDAEGLSRSLRGQARKMSELGESLQAFGTSSGVEDCHALQDFPLRNWQLRSWDGAGALSGSVLAETVLKGRYHCARCPIGCGRVVQVTAGPFRTPQPAGGPEYESLGSLGGNLLVDDIEAVTLANDLCNRFGMDTISVGQAVGLAFEAFERGYIGEKDLGGLRPEWGDAAALVSLVRQIGERREIGEVLGLGVRQACAELVAGEPELDLQVKGLEIPSHDPRAFASIALGYATSPRGACHLQAYSHGLEAWLAMPELGFPEVLDRFSAERKAELTVKMQDLMCVFDSLKMCKFVLYTGVTVGTLVEWLDRVTGWGLDRAELLAAGRRIFDSKLLFNSREGVNRQEDRLPQRLARSDIGRQLPRMLEEYYRLRSLPEKPGRIK